LNCTPHKKQHFRRKLKYIMMSLLFFCPVYLLNAEAYLSEDMIYYGGDTFTIDYSKEIIYAKGNAFFRRGEKTVRAKRIVIYYSKDQKRAELFNDVIVVDRTENITIRGEYGEAFYLQGIYRIQRKAGFKDPKKEITSDLIETKKDSYTRFEGNVNYEDNNYTITAPLLTISEGTAIFSSGVSALGKNTDDRLYCDSIIYLLDSGKTTFQGDVLLIQGNNNDNHEKPLIMAGVIKYLPEEESYILLENVFIRTPDTAIKAPVVSYFREKGYMHAYGGVSIHQQGRDIYSGDVEYYSETENVVLYGMAEGVFKPEIQ